MNKFSALLFTTLSLTAPLLVSSCTTAKATKPAAQVTEADTFELELAEGEILQFILDCITRMFNKVSEILRETGH